MTAYKVVVPGIEKDEYFSRYYPSARNIKYCRLDEYDGQGYYPIRHGEIFIYIIGEKVSSSFKDTPGLYCYISINAALFAELFLPKGCTLLVVTIPKGTQIKRAKSTKFALGNDVILAEEVIPINVFSQNCNGKLELAL